MVAKQALENLLYVSGGLHSLDEVGRRPTGMKECLDDITPRGLTSIPICENKRKQARRLVPSAKFRVDYRESDYDQRAYRLTRFLQSKRKNTSSRILLCARVYGTGIRQQMRP